MAETSGWALEVVRGRDVGRLYDLPNHEVTLGNAGDSPEVINLSDQESGPQRITAQHAAIAISKNGLLLRNVDSGGKTFVNKRPLLPEQSVGLRLGDIVQLGGVQLRITAGANALSTQVPSRPVRPRPSVESAPPRPNSTTQGTGKDEESDSLTTIPGPTDPSPPRQRPTSRPSTTNAGGGRLEANPPELKIQVGPSSRTRRMIRVSHRGSGIQRTTIQVDPAGTDWISLPSTYLSGFELLETPISVPVTINAPSGQSGPLTAELLIRSDEGGSIRVPVTIEPRDSGRPPTGSPPGSSTPRSQSIPPETRSTRPSTPRTPTPRPERFTSPVGRDQPRAPVNRDQPQQPKHPDLTTVLPEPISPHSLTAPDATQPFPRDETTKRESHAAVPPVPGKNQSERVPKAALYLLGALLFATLRLLIGLSSGFGSTVELIGPVVMFGIASGLAGGLGSARLGSLRDLPGGLFSGAFVGLLIAAIGVALSQGIEPKPDSGLLRTVIALPIWALLGGGIAALADLVGLSPFKNLPFPKFFKT